MAKEEEDFVTGETYLENLIESNKESRNTLCRTALYSSKEK